MKFYPWLTRPGYRPLGNAIARPHPPRRIARLSVYSLPIDAIHDPDAALGLVTQRLTGAVGISIVSSLLAVAAGETAVAQGLTQDEYDLLAAHRLLTLIPADWWVDGGRDLAQDKRKLVTQQMMLLDLSHKSVDALAARGIDSRVLKGAASCELDYPSSAQRTIGDVDLLVSPSDFPASLRALKAHLGATPPPVGPAGYDFSAGVALATPAGHEIDVHYRLRRTTPEVPALFDEPIALPNGTWALNHEARLVHAACHLLLTSPGARRLSGLADISAIRARHRVDLDRVRHLARQLGCESLCAISLQIERTLRGLPIETSNWQQPSALERASFARRSNRVVAQYMYEIAAEPTLRQSIRHVRYRLVPIMRGSLKNRGLRNMLGRATPSELGGRALRNRI